MAKSKTCQTCRQRKRKSPTNQKPIEGMFWCDWFNAYVRNERLNEEYDCDGWKK